MLAVFNRAKDVLADSVLIFGSGADNSSDKQVKLRNFTCHEEKNRTHWTFAKGSKTLISVF